MRPVYDINHNQFDWPTSVTSPPTRGPNRMLWSGNNLPRVVTSRYVLAETLLPMSIGGLRVYCVLRMSWRMTPPSTPATFATPSQGELACRSLSSVSV